MVVGGYIIHANSNPIPPFLQNSSLFISKTPAILPFRPKFKLLSFYFYENSILISF